MAGKTYEGIVTSAKMKKTLVVQILSRKQEPRTGKIVSSSKKYKIHCEDESISNGDVVSFTDCRPMSKDKKWRFVSLVKKGEQYAEAKEDLV